MGEPKNAPMSFSADTTKKLGDHGYTIGKQIGYGSYSNVYKGKKIDKGGKQTEIAIKVIDLIKASPNYRDKFFPREFNMIHRIKHKYIVLTHDVYTEKEPKKGIYRAFIFMELAKTDLLTVIEKQNKIDDVQARVWFHQICQGLEYMHSKHWAHRDLKLENILINSKNVAQISDFGFVKETPPKVLSSTYCGSTSYAAPEILKNVPYDPFAADVWSLGVCIYATLSGHMPFHDKHDRLDNLKRDQMNVEKIVAKSSLSKGAKDLLTKMLRYKEKDRITMKDALKHEWFNHQQIKSK